MQDIEIKAYPFCGSEANIYNEWRDDHPCHYYVYVIKCEGCGARTKDFINNGYYGECYTKEDVIAVWNNRK